MIAARGSGDGAGGTLQTSIRSAVLWTLLTRVGLLPLALLQGILLARQLGPAGLGLYSALLLDVNVSVTVLSVGLPGALSVLIGEDPSRLRALSMLSLRSLLLHLVVPAVVLTGVALRWPGLALRLSRAPIEIALISLAAVWQFGRDVLGGLLLGTQQFGTQNRQALLLSLFQFALCVALYLLGWLTPHSAVLLQVIGNVVLCLLSFVALRRVARKHKLWRVPASSALSGSGAASSGGSGPAASSASLASSTGRRELARRAREIGGRNFLHIIPDLLLMRIDVYLIQRFLAGQAQKQLGIYQAGVRIAELVLLLPTTLNTVLFAKAAAREDLTRVTIVSAKVSLLLGLVATGFMALFGQPILVLFYGERFAGSFVPCLLVLLGCCSLCFVNPLAGTLAGEGAYPRSVIWSQGVALLLNVALNLYLIPHHGIVGAALASTLSYALSAVVLSAAFAVRFRVSVWELLRPESPGSLLAPLLNRRSAASTKTDGPS